MGNRADPLQRQLKQAAYNLNPTSCFVPSCTVSKFLVLLKATAASTYELQLLVSPRRSGYRPATLQLPHPPCPLAWLLVVPSLVPYEYNRHLLGPPRSPTRLSLNALETHRNHVRIAARRSPLATASFTEPFRVTPFVSQN